MVDWVVVFDGYDFVVVVVGVWFLSIGLRLGLR